MRNMQGWKAANTISWQKNICRMVSVVYFASISKGGKEGAMRFTNALKLIAIVTHVADARTAFCIRQAIPTDS